MVFKFFVIEGKIYFILYNIFFIYGIIVGFSVGFFGFVELKYEVFFNFLYGYIFVEFILIGIRKMYEFLLVVFVGVIYVVKVLVYEV